MKKTVNSKEDTKKVKNTKKVNNKNNTKKKEMWKKIIMVIILLVLTPVGIVVDKKIEAYFENKREP